MEGLLAGVESRPEALLQDAYGRLLLGALARRASRAKHGMALAKASAHLKGRWSADERRETEARIAAFRSGLAPLIAPLVLLSHYAGKYDVPFLLRQHYLDPDPAETMLLYHA
jgi:uncharacterized protein YbgA (DUF1722 family)